ncbi:MAG: hypothetical protein HY074_07185 [Deltaproteobacteria bacterium]|nr:hypothetical protein [Deltaproteobacteria bacterium]
MRASILALITVSSLSMVYSARAEEPEPVRTLNIDAAYKSETASNPQGVISIEKKAVKKSEDGKVEGAAIAGSFSFPVAFKPDAAGNIPSIMLPTARAGFEYFNGGLGGALIVRGLVSRDLGLGLNWATMAAIGFQLFKSGKDSSIGTLQPLPLQNGFSFSVTGLGEAGAGQIDILGKKARALYGARLEEVVQYCASLDSYNDNMLCANLSAYQKIGNELGVGGDASLIFAHAIEEGMQKGYIFIAPTAGADSLAATSDTCSRTTAVTAGGRIGIKF